MSSTVGEKSPWYTNVSSNSVLIIVVQVLVGLLISYLLYLISLRVVKSDKLVIDDKFDTGKKTGVSIVDGFIDAAKTGVRFNTDVPYLPNYVPIKPSVNIKGGAQFTYSFWIFMGPGVTDANASYQTIFLKGSNARYDFTIDDNILKTQKVMSKERMVHCPMFRFGSNAKSFEVVFNTLNRYDETLSIESLSSEDSMYRNNLLQMLNNQWIMISISFEDNIPINEFENGVIVKFHVNETLYKVGRFTSALKQNFGDLYLFPNEVPLADVKLSNMIYYNYVVSDSEVRNLYAKGPNTSTSSIYIKPESKRPPTLSDYNNLDIYNA